MSPNGKWLIYELDDGNRSGEHKFILATADGVQQKEMPFDSTWGWSSIFWLNDSALRVAEIDSALTQINNFAFDPFTGAKIALRSEFDGMADQGIDWHIDRSAIETGVSKGINIIYDPTLTRALYPRNDTTVSLFNLETDQELARLSVPGRGRLPRWSPNGQELTIIRKAVDSSKDVIWDEFLIIPRDGLGIRRLSYSTSVNKQIHIQDYSWSPDGNQIAFWLKTDKYKADIAQNSFELAVLDLETNEVTNYCVSGTSIVKHQEYTDMVHIIWSPSGTQLLIVRYNDDHHENTDEIIVDLISKTIYKVAENMQPIGWMTKEQ